MKIKRLLIAMALAMAGLALVLALPRVTGADPGVIYVDADATGANDGSSWTDAYTEVQSALAVTVDGDEIWVAEGVYRPDYDPDLDAHTGYVTAAFVLTDGVALYGGFDPGSGIDVFEERDWEAHVTVLSGDLDGDDTTDAYGVVTDTADITGSNAWTVVSGSDVTGTAVLDGFAVTAGNADGGYTDCDDHEPCRSGGGMYSDSGLPTLTDVIFSGNRAVNAGGGMYNGYGGDPTLVNVTFSANSALDGGGGMYNHYSAPALTDVTFNSNSADWDGGGMSNYSSAPTLDNVTFNSNSAGWDGGGGMRNFASTPTLTDVTFSGNTADFGGGMYNHWYSYPTLTDVTFSGNQAVNEGGGMYNRHYSDLVLTDVTFSENQADDYGGGMYNWDSDPTLTNVTFSGNQVIVSGGGMYNWDSNPTLTNVTFSGNSASWSGGGMDNWESDPTLVNVTFSGNSAGLYGGGMYNRSSGLTLANAILWENSDGGGSDQSAQIHIADTSPITVTYSLVQGGVYTGTGNVSADPLFVRDPDPGDGDWTTLADNDYGDLSLLPSSPAIDAGDNGAVPSGVTTDRGGSPRFFDVEIIPDTGTGTPPIVDMGAYEATWQLQHQLYLPLVLRN